MTNNHSGDNEQSRPRLDQLYADQEAIEPPAGLDRMIRAQAEQAIEQELKAKPTAWMGGLATAAVLVVAVAVIIQTPEPSPGFPMAEPVPGRSIAPPLAEALDSAQGLPVAADQAEDSAADDGDTKLDRVKTTGSRVGRSEAEVDASFNQQNLSEASSTQERRQRAAAAPEAVMSAPASAEAARVPKAFSPEALADQAAGDQEVAGSAESLSPWMELEHAIERADKEAAEELLEALRMAFPNDERLDDLQQRVRDIEST